MIGLVIALPAYVRARYLNLPIPVVMVGFEPTFDIISTTNYEYRAYKTPSVHYNLKSRWGILPQ